MDEDGLDATDSDESDDDADEFDDEDSSSSNESAGESRSGEDILSKCIRIITDDGEATSTNHLSQEQRESSVLHEFIVEPQPQATLVAPQVLGPIYISARPTFVPPPIPSAFPNVIQHGSALHSQPRFVILSAPPMLQQQQQLNCFFVNGLVPPQNPSHGRVIFPAPPAQPPAIQQQQPNPCPPPPAGTTAEADAAAAAPSVSDTTCGSCGKKFHTANNLKVHVKEIHDEKGRGQYPCADCGQVYSRLRSLERHQNQIHLGDSPVCRICRKKVVNFDLHYRKFHCKSKSIQVGPKQKRRGRRGSDDGLLQEWTCTK